MGFLLKDMFLKNSTKVEGLVCNCGGEDFQSSTAAPNLFRCIHCRKILKKEAV